MIKDFVGDAIKYLPAMIVPGIVGFISIPIVTRLFSPVDYGNYNLVMATIMILTAMLGWLPMGISRFYPAYERDKKLDIFYGNIIKLSMVSLVFVVFVFNSFLFSIKSFLNSDMYLLMSVGIGVFVLNSIFEIFKYLLRAKREVHWFSCLMIWKSIAGIGFGLALILLFQMGVEGLFWGTILCICAALPFLWKLVFKDVLSLQFKLDVSLVKEIAKYGLPLVLGSIAVWILSLSDRYILEFYRGSQEVGIYSASYNIADRTIMLLINLFMLASSPILIRTWEKEGERKSKEFVTKITRYYLIICIPAIVGLSVLSKPIMGILTGSYYFEGYRIIPFVAAGIFLVGLQQRFQAGILLYKRTRFITLSVFIASVMNLALNFLFVPRYGYMAAAFTTLVSYIILLICIIVVSRRFFIWQFPFKSLIKVSCISAIMGIVMYLIYGTSTSLTLIELAFSICLGISIYFSLLFLFREVKPNEQEAIKQVLGKYLTLRRH